MFETAEDIERMQHLLDDSYARAGDHLRMIHTAAARLAAREVVERLDGMRVFVLATASTRGTPLTAPVDTYLAGGRLHFGTSPASSRARHLAVNPAVSATYVEGEGVVVTVHGRAVPVDIVRATAFAEAVRAHHGGLGVYEDASSWAIEPTRMFAADMTVHAEA